MAVFLFLHFRFPSMSISCIIIDDEPNALHLLEEYAEKTPSISLKGKIFRCRRIVRVPKKRAGRYHFYRYQYALTVTGTRRDSPTTAKKLIFTTAFAEHALTSFRYHVIDYLLKPISFKRFLQAASWREAMTSSLSFTPSGYWQTGYSLREERPPNHQS